MSIVSVLHAATTEREGEPLQTVAVLLKTNECQLN